MSTLQERTRFEAAEVELRIAERWIASGLHHPQPAGTPDENYSIAVPPPNVTGVLHVGHALNGSVQDALIRYHRMKGMRTKWILGTDHAGIATQKQVEKLLGSEGRSREALGREAFVERVWQWREQYGGQIIEQFKRLGATLDYDDKRFPPPPGTTSASPSLRSTRARCSRSLSPCTARASSTATTTSSTGTRARSRRSATSRSRTARRPTRCSTSPTRSRTARARWSWRRCARRRCWPTPPSR